MACPFFMPVAPLDPGEWIHAPRLPLIVPYGGVCKAAGEFTPPESLQRDLCNHGYARGHCENFPRDSAGGDAVRFSVICEESGALRLRFAVEKDHSPIAHGDLEYRDTCCAGSPDELIERQARAFAQSYLARKSQS